MAKIRDAKPKNSSGGYERLVKNEQISTLLKKVQSTVISNGSELERIITEMSNTIDNLDEFIQLVNENNKPDGSYLCTKKILKNSKYSMPKHEPDFIIFQIEKNKRCSIIELKDGDSFDTKKSTSELENLQEFTKHIATQIPFIVNFYICCFNQNNKEKIIDGFKKRFKINEVMTGQEFCDLLKINYNEIISNREKDAIDNMYYIVTEMSNIQEIKDAVNNARRQHISEDEFYKEL